MHEGEKVSTVGRILLSCHVLPARFWTKVIEKCRKDEIPLVGEAMQVAFETAGAG